MAGSRHPGSLGAFGNHPIIDAGTLASVANPLPGPMPGLLQVLGAASDMELGEHWSGMAFDVQPVERDAEAIKKTINSLPYLDLFLEKEGGMVRWHVQF